MATDIALCMVAPDDSKVRLRWDDATVAVIELVDTEQQNALSPQLTGALLHALDVVAQTPECRTVILCGTAEWFSSGAPRSLLVDLKASRVAPSELGLSEALLHLPVVVIAALEGSAAGGGFALAMACDVVVASETGRYGLNFMAHGITPGMGVTRIAEDFLGRPLAHRMLYSGDFLRGADLPADRITITPRAQVMQEAFAFAYALADKPRDNVAALKRTLVAPRLAAFSEARTLEMEMHAHSLAHLDITGWGTDDLT